ncbi:sulfate transporter, partial [Trifolium medium]|nr:sulfate transporter [Trifolium medium]
MKVAKLPAKDRREVLKILKRNVCRRKGGKSINRSCKVLHQSSSEAASSSVSINNDWKNWMVMHGDERMVVDDVWGIGRAIGMNFKGDNANMFNALSRAGRRKQ